jgi:hypothetical protein
MMEYVYLNMIITDALCPQECHPVYRRNSSTKRWWLGTLHK